VLNPNGVGNASEVIVGTILADRISGGGGNDAIYGEAGNDTIDGDSGVDFLHAGDGDDSINGGAENDLLYGELGNDFILGGIGADLMFGGEGDDIILGGLDADLINGGEGNDLMYGGDGILVLGVLDPEPAVAVALIDDVMHGSDGNDTMYGGGGWDDLEGESGHDVLIPGTGGVALGGRDAMDGGQGDDIYITESSALFAFQDYSDTGLTQLQQVGKDTYRVGRGVALDEVRFTQTVADNFVIGAVNNLGVGQVFTGIERVVIGTGTANAANRTGLAAINIDASLANVGLDLGLEILGNAGANILVGTAFNDTIDGGAGADTMEGTLGNDVYIVDHAADMIIELGGGGTDSVIVDAAINYTLADDLENLTLRNANALQATGNNLDNIIVGNNSANTLVGLIGNDNLNGGAGNDIMRGGAGIDIMTGGTGVDRFVFGSNIAEIGNNPLFRETITDFVGGNAGDRLDFSAAGSPRYSYIGELAFSAANQLRFEAGVLYGNVNANPDADFQIALNGVNATGVNALAANNFIMAASTLSVTAPAAGVFEGTTGATSTHTFTVSLSAATAVPVTFTYAVTGIAANAADFPNSVFPAGTGTILPGQTSTTISVLVRGDTTIEQNETFRLTVSGLPAGITAGTLTANGTILNDDAPGQLLNGGAAGNTLTGGVGNDTINGQGGNDILNGNFGDDRLNGGAGRDTLTGGLGIDTFIYLATDESGVGINLRDTIVDFASGIDKVDVTAIDADSGVAGNQAFTFIGADAFTALGQARYAGGLLEFNNNNITGINIADMQILLPGPLALLGTDILL